MDADHWISLGTGFGGVVIGALLTWGLQRWDRHVERTSGTAFLALIVSTVLYRYADELWGIIADNDFFESSKGHAGTEHYQVPEPPVLPATDDPAWRGMYADLLTRCMEFPDEVMQSRRAIEFYLDLNGPDSGECVEQATGLALKALALAADLRARFKWPTHEMRFDYRKRLESRQAEFEARQQIRDEAAAQND